MRSNKFELLQECSVMRRLNNNLSQDVILFLGECEIITLNSTHQIALAHRTILLKQKMLYTYQNPLSQLKETKLSAFSRSKNAAISIQKLMYYECEYKIEATMRARLLIGRRDEGVESYLRQLKIQKANKETTIVAVINQQQKFINGFVFSRQAVALEFYQSLNVAIFTQLYQLQLPSTLPFNYKLANMIGSTLNGLCLIDPDDFSQIQEQQEEINFVISFLKGLSSEQMLNFTTYLYEMQLKFRIIDDMSKTYACRFLEIFPQKIDKLVMANCQLTSNMASQLLPLPLNLSQKLVNLQELNLSNNCLNDDIFTTITKMLTSSKKLHLLNFNHNQVTFEKESILVGFLSSIVNISVKLSLTNNRIAHIKNIVKYLVHPEQVPLADLDISFNPISPQDLVTLTKAYLAKANSKQNGSYEFKLHLNQLQFEDPHSFQFLQHQYWLKKPNTMFIPMSISKHTIRKKGKDLGNNEQELKRSLKIQELFKEYGIQVFRGNFYKLNQIVAQLKHLKVDEETIQSETLKYRPYKQQQELMIIRKMEACLNLEVSPSNIIPQINQTLRFCRRKGLTGTAFNLFACVKHKIETFIDKLEKQQNFGLPYLENTFLKKGRYKSFYQRICTEQSLLNFNYCQVYDLSEKQLRTFYNKSQIQNLSIFMLHHYILCERPNRYHRMMVESCLTDPRMASLKIARFEKDNIVQIYEKIRVTKAFLQVTENKIDFITIYGIENYTFSQSFIQSGISSSTYIGVLSRKKIEAHQQPIVLAFIQICKNFLKYLYYTPNEISQHTIVYLNSIVAHLANLQNENDNDFKNVLAEELLLHMITFYDSTRYQPLPKGVLLSISEFIARRISFEGDLLKRLAAFLMKLQPQTELQLHQSSAREPWEGKVDWKITDLEQFKTILLKRGKIEVKIADVAHPQLPMVIEVDELDTVLDLWKLVLENIGKLNEFTNLTQNNINYYWICGIKNDSGNELLKFLPSYQHIGKLIFEDRFDCTFYLRRVLYSAEEHSLDYLRKVKYQQLVAIYEQAKQSFRIASTFLLSAQLIIQCIILTIWIDILITEQLMLATLRRQNDEESQYRYRAQRQKIVNDCISKLYKKYKPTELSLDEASRNTIILEIKSRQMSGVVKNINETIKELILSLISKIKTIGYATPIYDRQDKFTMLITNHYIIFVDRTKPQPNIIHIAFANIIWFQLAVEYDLPLLKFDLVQSIEAANINIRKLSIQGDSLWIGQCFALITQIAKNRLSYPSQMLFCNEDDNLGITQYKIRTETKSLLTFPILQIDKYFAFTLSRKHEFTAVAAQIPPNPPAVVPQSSQGVPQPQKQIKKEANPDPIPNLISAPAVAEQIRRSSKQVVPRNAQIEQILQAAQRQQQQVQQQEQVITSRKSANSKKDVPRRRSRNR